jgi:glycosyltransferase involved in cell wall biosynthesis
VYEPFGIINLEAMACQTPVVATATGGIKEAVEDGVTGFLVPFESYANSNTPGPKDPKKFSMDLANAINGLLKSPEKIHQMGSAARGRVETLFSWKSIARQTLEFYTELIETTEVRG